MPSRDENYEIRYVGAPHTLISPEDLDQVFEEGTVETAESSAAARTPPLPDCLLIPFTNVEPTPQDLVDTISPEHSIPIVLLVEPDNGSVPAAALEPTFTDAIIIQDPETAPDAVRTQLLEVLPSRTKPRIDRADTTDQQTRNEWKSAVLDQFFQKIPIHMFVKDTEAYNVMVSEALVKRRIHQQSDQYIGKRDIDGVVPFAEGIEPYQDDLRVLNEGITIQDKEEYYSSTDRTFLTSKAPLTDETNQVIGLIGIAEEITGQKQRERQLEAVNHIVRHTMRNDLNAIAGWIEMLNPDRQEDMAIVERLNRLANGLVRKIDKQQQIVEILTHDPDPQEMNISRVVTQELDDVAAEHPDVRIRRDISPGIHASVTPAFDDAIRELVDNAVAHSTDSTPIVEVDLQYDESDIVMRFSDYCTPIPASEREILTSNKPIDKLNHTSGLGLWMVRWIVESFDGTIDFSYGDPGNEITIRLPAEPLESGE